MPIQNNLYYVHKQKLTFQNDSFKISCNELIYTVNIWVTLSWILGSNPDKVQNFKSYTTFNQVFMRLKMNGKLVIILRDFPTNVQQPIESNLSSNIVDKNSIPIIISHPIFKTKNQRTWVLYLLLKTSVYTDFSVKFGSLGLFRLKICNIISIMFESRNNLQSLKKNTCQYEHCIFAVG